MRRPSSFPIALVSLVFGLAAACGGEKQVCAPTDPSCGTSSDPLLVTSVLPADGTRHVDWAAPVILTFSRAVDPASVTSTSVTVGSAAGSLAVSGAKVTFTPSAPLAEDADFLIRAQGVRAADGGGMAAAFTSGFRTRTDAVCDDCPSTGIRREDVQGEGVVVETEDGFTVDGTLSISMGETESITFLGADVDVRFDASGNLQSISGKVEIPSPHERIEFDDPVRADVGVFKGSFLNQERELGILLKDDTDYFVFDFQVSLAMSIATGETGEGATKPITVSPPVGGRMLMVMDFEDPMYYIYGAQDLLGSIGTGWSLNGRIPFVPKQTVNGLGTFDGSATLVGGFSIFEIVSVDGQLVDNQTTELHLSEEDPFASSLRADYQAGFNGDMSLGIPLAGFVSFEIPIADASGGIRAEAGTHTGFNGFLFAKGMTSRDDSWWPAFIPARPVLELDAHTRVESDGTFEVFLAGEYGWDFPSGRESMSGSFEITEQAMTLAGAMQDGDVELAVTGVVTGASTTVFVTPPPELLSLIHSEVSGEVMGKVDEAQQAWESLKEATADYEFELSLRGLRSSIPATVDAVKKAVSDAITSQLNAHKDEVYHSQLVSHVNSAVKPYYTRLDQLKAAALQIQDNDATRDAIESALRSAANNGTFSTKFTYTVFGVPVATVTISRQVLTSSQVTALRNAADNVKYIEETSDIKISMQQIYDQVPDRQLFEQVRDDIQNGLLIMEEIGELGFVFPHSGTPAFNLYAVIDGKRYELGTISAMTVAELAAGLPAAMLEALKSN
jgi:hypothetical protein